MADISLTVNINGEVYHLKTHANEYRNLMMLIYDKIGPEDFGDCLGMGKCGTCLVAIESKIGLSSHDRNEETTLRRAGTGYGSRLACQILIDEQINGLTVKVLMP